MKPPGLAEVTPQAPPRRQSRGSSPPPERRAPPEAPASPSSAALPGRADAAPEVRRGLSRTPGAALRAFNSAVAARALRSAARERAVLRLLAAGQGCEEAELVLRTSDCSRSAPEPARAPLLGLFSSPSRRTAP